MLELLLAFLENMRSWAIGCLIVGAIWLSFYLISSYCDCIDDFSAKAIKKIAAYKYYLVTLFVLSAMPSIEDLWRIRITLIKFELASPQNIVKTTEAIERIGSELERKYLGKTGK